MFDVSISKDGGIRNDRDDRATKRLERSSDVLWSLSPTGIVLHQLRTRRYMELDRSGYYAWALLDGARTVSEVIERMCESGSAYTTHESPEVLARIIDALEQFQFVVERE